MKVVRFLGKVYSSWRHSSVESFTLKDSNLSIYCKANLILVYLGQYQIFQYTLSSNDLIQDPLIILQKVLDENQELILKRLSRKIEEFAKISSSAKNEFDKVLIFV